MEQDQRLALPVLQKSPNSGHHRTPSFVEATTDDGNDSYSSRRRRRSEPSLLWCKQVAVAIVVVTCLAAAIAIAGIIIAPHASFSSSFLDLESPNNDQHSSWATTTNNNNHNNHKATNTAGSLLRISGHHDLEQEEEEQHPDQQQQQHPLPPQPGRVLTTNLVVGTTTGGLVHTVAANAGGPDVNISGVVWRGDMQNGLYQDPLGRVVDNSPNCTNLVLPSTMLPTHRPLFCHLRDSPVRYVFLGLAATNTYSIDLYFYADTMPRRFDVSVQGTVRASDWTLFRQPHSAYLLSIRDVVVQFLGIIDIGFKPIGVSGPLLAGFRIYPQQAVPPVVPTAPPPPPVPPPVPAPVPPPPPPTPPTAVTYRPGSLYLHAATSLYLSTGLSVKVIAQSGQYVRYHNGTVSTLPFHAMPDGAATYPIANTGGWIYVSNSEVPPRNGTGGVGAITFDRLGNVVDYKMLLNNTKMNCGGGKTSWGAWISGEEHPHTGRIWQVDPFGKRPAVAITMGDTNKGLFESFAYDDRNIQQPRFFATKDHLNGALRRLYVLT
jgi:hypothetical protein